MARDKKYGGIVPSSGSVNNPSGNSAGQPSGGGIIEPMRTGSGGTSGSGSVAPTTSGSTKPSSYVSSPRVSSTGVSSPGSSSSTSSPSSNTSSSSSNTSGMTSTTSSTTTKGGETTTKESTEPKPFLDFDKMFEYQKRINNELDLPMLRETNKEGYKYRSMEASDTAGHDSVARREAGALAMQRDVLSSDLERGTMRQQQALQTRTKDQDLARALSTVMGRRK